MNLYLIGSLRNPRIPEIAKELRQDGHTVFDDWFAAGPEADDKWRDYEKARGRTYLEALNEGYTAKHVFMFDLAHLETAEAVVLALPAGKSGHLELGWALGREKPGFILLDNPERWDVMYQFADGVYDNLSTLKAAVKNLELERFKQSWSSDIAALRQQSNTASPSPFVPSNSAGIGENISLISSSPDIFSRGGDNGR